MATTTIIYGGSGKCARHITRLLASSGHTVYSVIRNQEQGDDVASLGGKAVVQNIEESSIADMASTMKEKGVDVCVWAAGAGAGSPERTTAVDQDGAIKCFEATAKAGVKRLIVISALDVRDRENRPEPEWYDGADRDRSDKVWSVIKPFMRAKYAADRNLVSENERRGLEYTIVRPGGLTNGPGNGTVDAGKVHLAKMISREDVARVVVECVKNEGTKGLAFDVVGGETTIKDAVEHVARERIDTFAGRY